MMTAIPYHLYISPTTYDSSSPFTNIHQHSGFFCTFKEKLSSKKKLSFLTKLSSKNPKNSVSEPKRAHSPIITTKKFQNSARNLKEILSKLSSTEVNVFSCLPKSALKKPALSTFAASAPAPCLHSVKLSFCFLNSESIKHGHRRHGSDSPCEEAQNVGG